MEAEDEERIGICKFPFSSEEETEMSLLKGDVVVIVEEVGDGWSFCYMDDNPDRNGYVPTQYLNVSVRKVDKTLLQLESEEPPPQEQRVNETKPTPQVEEKKVVNVNNTPNSTQQTPVSRKPLIKEVVTIKREVKPVFAKNFATTKKVNDCFQKYLKFMKFKRFLKMKRFKDQQNRFFNIQETITTEETYLKQLKFCVSNIKTPMMDQKIIKSDTDFKGLYSDIEQITSISQNLLSMLQQTREVFPDHLKIAPCFKRISPFFKMYRNYVNNYDESMKILEKCRKKNTRFVSFCDNIMKNTPKYCFNYKIEDFLILPIQRIPRYRMLLNNIMKLTHHEHLEFADLKDALRIVEEVANFVNRAKKQKILEKTKIEINEFLKGRYSDFIQAHRHLIRFTKCRIRCDELGTSSKFAPFFAYLFNDLILLVKVGEGLFKKKNIDFSDIFKKKGVSKEKTFFLFLVTMEAKDGDDPTQFMEPKKVLILKLVLGGKEVVVDMQFQDRKERIEWQQAIDINIANIVSESKKKYENLNVVKFSRERVKFIKKEDLEENPNGNSNGSHNGVAPVEYEEGEFKDGERAGGIRTMMHQNNHNVMNRGRASSTPNRRPNGEMNDFSDVIEMVKQFRDRKTRLSSLEEEKEKIMSEVKKFEEELMKTNIENMEIQKKQAEYVSQLGKLEKGYLDSVDAVLTVLEPVIKNDNFFLSHGLAGERNAFREIFGGDPLDTTNLPTPGPSKYMYTKKRVNIK